MPLVKCRKHGIGGSGGNRGAKHTYAAIVQPTGFPNSALVCGNAKCMETGYVWLTPDEFKLYQKGERVFKPTTATLGIKLSDLFEELT